MSAARGVLGAVAGAAAAGIAFRVRSAARSRNQPVTEVLADLPGILVEDATRVADAARHAVDDGREATRRARIDFDEQVGSRGRRTKGTDG